MSCIPLLLREMTKNTVFRVTGWESFRPDDFEGKLVGNKEVLEEISRGTNLLIINKRVYRLNGLAKEVLGQIVSQKPASIEASSVFDRQCLGRVNP